MFDQLTDSLEAAWSKLRKEGTFYHDMLCFQLETIMEDLRLYSLNIVAIIRLGMI